MSVSQAHLTMLRLTAVPAAIPVAEAFPAILLGVVLLDTTCKIAGVVGVKCTRRLATAFGEPS